MILFQNSRLVPCPQEKRAIKLFAMLSVAFATLFVGFPLRFVGILLSFEHVHPAADSAQTKRVKKK